MEREWIPRWIKRAVAGGLVGLGITVGLHLVWGFVIGTSNDYQLGQKYNAKESFQSIFIWVVPFSIFAGAVTSLKKK
ncbi:MAG: hypothetical protein WCI55_14730 [Armatimonadota bacterium]